MSNPKGIRLFHILVSHKYEAEDIIKLIEQGKSFSELAKRFSICSSSNDGGDISNVNWKKLDDDFREAAEQLPFEQINKAPIRTKFGYHIVLKMPEIKES